MHLDYRDETVRLKEIRTIKQKLDSLLPQPETIASSRHIWVGDFNALTKENYNYNQWNQISKVRLDNKWESPQNDVMQEVFIDNTKDFDFMSQSNTQVQNNPLMKTFSIANILR